ncbi:polysaccharide biosynthesis tyrosine autokinase [Roseobacter sinensis]|uniref:non-specific protein-tyrosine kinase n=1 Tax=Roseobacter sinensis TaxID=2931391 RepID=A0ABT3BL45_9RHOB|nr:polysaccharide biosynthesis tyrosine autokinase [Roseobacter sp. WL0113]MCV3273953.1 polysaccharide biosynthesis tyrosine autokinase [Roseobacter sp. WL0113]
MNTQNRAVLASNGSEDGAAQLAGFATTIWRGKWRVAAVALLAVLLSAIYAVGLATPVFKSDVVLVLETREEQVVDLEGVISGLSSDASVVQTEVEVLRSRGLAQKVVDTLDLTADPEYNPVLRPPSPIDQLRGMIVAQMPALAPPAAVTQPSEAQTNAAVVTELLDHVTVQNVSDSLVFQLTVASTSPDKAARIANAFAEAYVLDQLQVKYDATRQATVWLTERVSELKLELERSEAEVKSFQSSTDLIDAETLALLDRQMKEIRDRLETARTDLAAARAFEAELAALDGPRAILALTGDALLRRLLPGEDAPLTESQRSAAEARIAQMQDRASLEAERAANRVIALDASVQDLESRISAQSRDLIALEQLSREAEASRLLYEYFLNRLKETSAQQGIQQADSRILSPAVAPIEAALPRVPLILAAAALAGALIGIGLELRRVAATGFGFRTAQDLEKTTGKPVFGEIPIIRVRDRKAYFNYVSNKPVSALAEALRNLRTSVVMSSPDRPPRVIMVASALGGEGKTAVSLSLAKQLADLGKKVLLIEADSRQGSLMEYLNIRHKGPTLSDALQADAEWQSITLHDIAPGLDVIPGGRHKKNAADLFADTALSELIEAAKRDYDMIVIDTAPVLLVSDARIIARLADSILFAVRWDATSREQVLDGINKFESLGHRVSGLVLSQVDPKGMRRYGYGSTYGPYAAYGTSYFRN